MALFCAQTNAQKQTEPVEAASTEVLFYLAEFETDADPVELSELERKRASVETPAPDSKRDTELAHEPN